MSKGENLIFKLLKDNNVNFSEEIAFKDLRWKDPLRFDFGIYKDKTKQELLCLIEVDGEQHFKEIGPWGGRFGLLKRKEYDRKKNNYCIAHNIKLIRIPYWDFNKITFESLFNTPEYLVTSKWHNDLL